jgi:hypothetical protein
MKLRNLLFVLALFSIVGFGPAKYFVRIAPDNGHVGSENWIEQQKHILDSKADNVDSLTWVAQETRILESKADNLDKKVLQSSLIAYQRARKQGYDNQQLLTIVDYSKTFMGS